MVLRPTREDLKIVFFYSGKAILGIGILLIIPVFAALFFKEWAALVDFSIASLACFSFWLLTDFLFKTEKEPGWIHGMVIGSFSWILATFFGAIPYYLSGHFSSFLDACFDVMSGYTTTGLFLIQDLDHVANSLNMWRHLLTFTGGQGIIVLALVFLIKATGGGVKVYVAEGKEEKLLPNVVNTARAIWLISLVYLLVGTFLLWVINMVEGMKPVVSFFHALWLYMGAWSTGGFAPKSYNLLYYHSFLIEAITLVIFLMGSFNFALHWAMWRRNKREVFKNIETRSMTITALLTFSLLTLALIKNNVYPDSLSLFRKAFYLLLSGHTTTGFMTVYSRTLVRQWGEFAMLAISVAMAIGASACSTGGGIKGLRMGIIFKGILKEIKKLILPESAVVQIRFHHIKDVVLEDSHFRLAALIALVYIFTYLFGTLVGLYCGYPLADSLFEAVSAGSNSGLSCGLTSPFMPTLIKLVYIVSMWAGRLEFLALFGLLGFLYALVKGK